MKPNLQSIRTKLRLLSLSDKKEITVLETNGGETSIWKQVQQTAKDKIITVLSMDSEKTDRVQLQGESSKFISGFNLNDFDIIDLDGGNPVPMLKIIFDRGFKGIIHCNFKENSRRIEPELLKYCGYSDEMIAKAPELFLKNGFKKFIIYLQNSGKIKNLMVYNSGKDNYLYFKR